MHTLTTAESGHYLQFAETLADRAREITLAHFRQPLDIVAKQDASPVTIADQNCEAELRRLIAERFPEHAIIGEEHGASGSSRYQWILDPIDGTRSFISGFPVYCTLIALLIDGRCAVSLIDMPALGERFTAADGIPTAMNGKPIRTAPAALADAICYSTDPTMFNAAQERRRARLQSQIRQQRWTGDGYIYAMLAAGWIHLAVEADMKPYDYLPLIRIVENAGGMITDWQGRPLTLESNGEILAAASPELHAEALAVLQSGA